jgi:uncharacterized membrane protein YjgN (DUF898 family)
MMSIHLMNLVLAVLTLGIWRFWGIVRIRRYAWSHTAFLGDRLEYAGTGGELLRGFLLAMAVILPLAMGSSVAEVFGMTDAWLLGGIWGAKLVAFIFLIGVARHAARRYLASRTIWRGLRFHVTGSPWRWGAIQLGWLAATIATLGLARPWAVAAEARWSLGRLHLGTQPFAFTGTGLQLLRPWIASWLLALLSVALITVVIAEPWARGLADWVMAGMKARWDDRGPEELAATARFLHIGLAVLIAVPLAVPALLFAWYAFAAAAMRWRWQNTWLGGAQFAMPAVTGGKLARLQIGNALISFFSFGLLYPVLVRRNAAFLAGLLWTDRFPDVSAARGVGDGQRSGEGLASALDGGGAGIGI